MGKGSSPMGGGGELLGKDSSVKGVSDVKDMLSQRGKYPGEVDQVMAVSQRLNNLYGDEGVITQFQTAKMSGAAAYYDSAGNIAVNQSLMNSKGMDASHDAGVRGGFHPSRGNKSGMEAVASHEFGHALTDRAAKKLGSKNLESAARTIVERARKKTGHKDNLSMASAISGYAKYNFAECVAEAFGDWYCNGSKAKKESRAIVSVLNSIVKGGRK